MFCHSNILINGVHENHGFLHSTSYKGGGEEKEIQFIKAFLIDLCNSIGNVCTIQGPFA